MSKRRYYRIGSGLVRCVDETKGLVVEYESSDPLVSMRVHKGLCYTDHYWDKSNPKDFEKIRQAVLAAIADELPARKAVRVHKASPSEIAQRDEAVRILQAFVADYERHLRKDATKPEDIYERAKEFLSKLNRDDDTD